MCGHGGRNEGYEWGLWLVLPFTKADLALAAAKCPIYQQWKQVVSPQYETILQLVRFNLITLNSFLYLGSELVPLIQV